MPRHPSDDFWTQDHIDKAIAGFHAGKPYETIAFELHCTKNALTGKLHRMGFRRENPVRRNPNSTYRKKRPGVVVETVRVVDGAIIRKRMDNPVRGAIHGDTLGLGATQYQPVRLGLVKECCWPTTDRRPWRFCEAPTIPDKQYCPDHARLAFRTKVAA